MPTGYSPRSSAPAVAEEPGSTQAGTFNPGQSLWQHSQLAPLQNRGHWPHSESAPGTIQALLALLAWRCKPVVTCDQRGHQHPSTEPPSTKIPKAPVRMSQSRQEEPALLPQVPLLQEAQGPPGNPPKQNGGKRGKRGRSLVHRAIGTAGVLPGTAPRLFPAPAAVPTSWRKLVRRSRRPHGGGARGQLPPRAR